MKLYNTLFASVFSLGLCGSAVADLNDGLVAYYPFNASANDESGNGHHGEVNGATLTSDKFGNEDSAYSFNGFDAYIDMNNISEGITRSAWSYSIWVNKKDITTDGGIFNGRNLSASPSASDNRKNGLLWFDADGKILLFSKGSLDGAQIQKTGPSYIQNTWIHIVYIYDGNNTHSVYVNGEIDSNLTTETVGDVELTDDIGFQIGRHEYSSRVDVFFNGKLDEFRIYNRALSDTEIQQLYTLDGTDENDGTGSDTDTCTGSDTNTNECIATYNADGTLNIPCVSVPNAFGGSTIYEADMAIIPLSSPLSFELIDARIK